MMSNGFPSDSDCWANWTAFSPLEAMLTSAPAFFRKKEMSFRMVMESSTSSTRQSKSDSDVKGGRRDRRHGTERRGGNHLPPGHGRLGKDRVADGRVPSTLCQPIHRLLRHQLSNRNSVHSRNAGYRNHRISMASQDHGTHILLGYS